MELYTKIVELFYAGKAARYTLRNGACQAGIFRQGEGVFDERVKLQGNGNGGQRRLC